MELPTGSNVGPGPELELRRRYRAFPEQIRNQGSRARFSSKGASKCCPLQNSSCPMNRASRATGNLSVAEGRRVSGFANASEIWASLPGHA
jgi:hypothetical protein